MPTYRLTAWPFGSPQDVQGGRKLHEQIEQAIRIHDKLLVVLSEHSMGSEWVKTEIYHRAAGRNPHRLRRKLFPISLASVPGDQEMDRLRCTIRARTWGARCGNTSSRTSQTGKTTTHAYKKAFDRLLRDLKAEGQQPAQT